MTSMVADTVTHSFVSQAIGAWFLTMTALLLPAAAPLEVWLPGALFGIGLTTGAPFAPLTWWVYSRRRDLLDEDVEADDAGITIRSAGGENRQVWSVYRKARESSRTIVLTTGGPTGQVFSTTGMEPAQLQAFRELLSRVGILRAPTVLDRIRGVIGFAIGAATGIVTALTWYGAPPQ